MPKANQSLIRKLKNQKQYLIRSGSCLKNACVAIAVIMCSRRTRVSEPKGPKNKVGLTEAFEDKNKKGYAWNNLMLQRWSDPDGVEHRVLDDYERNRTLIDLTAQPEDIKQVIDSCHT
jgi:hypothetical protein